MIDLIVDNYRDEEILRAEGLDDAIIGICYNSYRLIYSISRCIEILSEGDEIEAIEYLEFNTFNTWVGEKTPIWCDDRF